MVLLVPRLSTKAEIREVPAPYVKEINLLILKVMLKGQQHIWSFFFGGGLDRGTGGHHFCTLPVPF